MAFNVQDIKSVLYDNAVTPLTTDGNSSVIDFGREGGCPASEIVLKISDVESGEILNFTIYSRVSGSFVATVFRAYITANGEYIWPVDNRVVPGDQLRLAHDLTLSAGTDGVKVHGHVRPRSL